MLVLFLYIIFYVADMIIIDDDIIGIQGLQHFRSHNFEMKDLRTLSYFVVTSVVDDYYLS
jgi:hypothetical protein